MPANIAKTFTGTSAIVSLRESPWHHEGVVITEPVSGPEMLSLAGLDYMVKEAPISVKVSRRESMEKKAMGWDSISDTPIMGYPMVEDTITMPNKVVYRDDTGETFGIVSSDYQVYQNHEVIEFFESLVKGGKIQYEVAGALGRGEKVWVLARIPGMSHAIGLDESVGYMAIYTGHKGNLALTIQPTAIRIVCQNTLSMAISERKGKKKKNVLSAGYSIRHTKNMKSNVSQIAEAYNKVLEDWNFTCQLNEFLAKQKMDDASLKDFFNSIIVDESKDEKEVSDRIENNRKEKMDTLMRLWNSPTNNVEGTAGSAYAALQTVVEYVDHEARTRKTDGKSESESRFASMLTRGEDLKNRAAELIMAQVGA